MLPLRMLRSRLAFFREDAQARVPQGSGPTAAEAQRRLQSWGSQMDLSAEVETGTALSRPSPERFRASYQGWEARAAVSSASIEAHTLQLSDSEELDAANARYTEDSPPQSHAYEELVEVVKRAVEKLCIDWPAEREYVRSRGKHDKHFLTSCAQSQRRGLPFLPLPRCGDHGRGNFCQIYLIGSCRLKKKGIKYSLCLATRFMGVLSTEVAPQQVLVLEQEIKALFRERGHRICTSFQQGNRVLQLVFHSFKEGWRVASHFRSLSSERFCHAAQVQNVNFETNRVSDPKTGLSR